MGMKGHAIFELTNAKTGEKRIYEDDNMVTNFLEQFCIPTGQLSYDLIGLLAVGDLNGGKYGMCGNLLDNFTKGLLLFEDVIDEDANNRIACTQITLLEELMPERFALEGMKYMIEHPDRDGWEQNHVKVTVQRDKAQAAERGIAIARGSSPRVRGPIGSILGLIVENAEGIKSAKILVVREDLADRWLEMKGEREVQVVEEKND